MYINIYLWYIYIYRYLYIYIYLFSYLSIFIFKYIHLCICTDIDIMLNLIISSLVRMYSEISLSQTCWCNAYQDNRPQLESSSTKLFFWANHQPTMVLNTAQWWTNHTWYHCWDMLGLFSKPNQPKIISTKNTTMLRILPLIAEKRLATYIYSIYKCPRHSSLDSTAESSHISCDESCKSFKSATCLPTSGCIFFHQTETTSCWLPMRSPHQ